ncbi:cellulose biosynthesis regulator diguanylate cyclase DgcQ [Superficieibacter sp. HKU1]|uniref:cellulose biosynthesis regulator diguanylate cyclase DgcQ n=1 Tax=Superficieibacter sp. HKU1 TaxID=3031919 RepID=UPI0023E23B4C|nr:cellulose biosynthesis regulator diguanylate cyclase DgcQ [Superficieibacter sp. HKU1]WES66665.1 cellulose biosynthesis regulator diguanylate cyclase DgcQ [Superficieibacter sp. HKU1]
MEKTQWLKKFGLRFTPGQVVSLCFIVVLICSSFLTWREVAVLEDNYISSQRNRLESVSHGMDMQLQFNMDRLFFLRNGMQAALKTPLQLKSMAIARHEFDIKRRLDAWSVHSGSRHLLTVNGVSDAFVANDPDLNRDDALLHNELTAALELGYLLHLSSSSNSIEFRTQYVSRAGFFVTSDPQPIADIRSYYAWLIAKPWFYTQSTRDNRGRGIRWYTEQGKAHDVQLITASIPLELADRWYGVLAMDVDVSALQRLLVEAIGDQHEGRWQLYDSQLVWLASSITDASDEPTLSATDRQRILDAIGRDTRGGILTTSGYISWQKLKNFDGIVLHVHTLREGLGGAFGNIIIALSLLWLAFTLILILSWIVIRRMVRNMIAMQESLEWRAWYDTLTRLPNRGALFDRAEEAVQACKRAQQPLCVIQFDLDHFKRINDQHGHQAGDRVLSHVGSLITNALRENDVAGRVGGEEFCIVLPNTTMAMAMRVAERIRNHISAKEFLVRKNTTLRISASLGVSSTEEHGRYEFEYLQSIADRRLYLAKQNGRNRVYSSG